MSKERAVVWGTLAQFWVDTEYDSAQLDLMAARIAACGFTLVELDRIALEEVCGAFGSETIAAFASAGFGMPLFFYPEYEARPKIERWVSRPRILSWINPFWWIGYLAARRFLRDYWIKLRVRISAHAEPTAVGVWLRDRPWTLRIPPAFRKDDGTPR